MSTPGSDPRPRASLALAAALTLAVVGAACAGPGDTPSHPARAVPPSPCPSGTAAGAPGPAATAPVPLADWPTYSGAVSRAGTAPAPPPGSCLRPRPAWTGQPLDADVVASPIVAGGLLIAATERDTVYAFDARTGQPRWSRHLAEPMNAGSLPCGDIAPVSGITGTPAADPVRGALYVVGFTANRHHMLYELALADGTVRSARPADPTGDSPLVDQQRGALTVANGRVYIPYGGLDGDCGAYHGSIVGVPVDAGSPVQFRVSCERECGIWAPGGPVVDTSGNLLVATGKGEPTDRYTSANTVLRLTPALQVADSFAPSNWAQLSESDTDLGSISPALLPGGILWVSGKEGTGYLLRQDRLGGIGGQAATGSACPTFAGTAVGGATVYIACPDQVAAVDVNTAAPSFSVAWRTSVDVPGTPILAYGALWVISTGSGSVLALDPTTGDQRYSLAGPGPAAHFATLAAAGGLVFAAQGRTLTAIQAIG